MLYFRSDTRSPEEVFRDGFTTWDEGAGDHWWFEAIKANAYTDKRGIGNIAVDADLSVAICLSTRFESAAIFPLKEGDSYIYAIALPDATKVEYEKDQRNIFLLSTLPDDKAINNEYKNTYIFIKEIPPKLYYIDENGHKEKLSVSGHDDAFNAFLHEHIHEEDDEHIPLKEKLNSSQLDLFWNAIIRENNGHSRQNVKLLKDKHTPTDIKQTIIDLHSLQVVQTRKIVSSIFKNSVADPSVAPYAGWSLYGYESIASKVSPENIICAVKIHRDVAVHTNLGSPYISDRTIQAIDRTFHVVSSITENESFKPNQSLSVESESNSHVIDVNYSKEKKRAIKKLQQELSKDAINSTNIYFGLGGKSF